MVCIFKRVGREKTSNCSKIKLNLFSYLLMPFHSFIHDTTNLIFTLLTSLLLCIMFATNYLVQDNNCTSLQNVYQACSTTIMVYTRICHSKLYHNQAWFRTKLKWVHEIIHPAFICINAWDLLWRSIRSAMLCILYPFLNVCQTPIYWASITSSCIGLLYVESSILLYNRYPPPSKKRIYCQAKFTLSCIFMKQQSPPLPQCFNNFSGVALNQDFVGWMKKQGKNFHRFTTSMNKIGTNTM